MIKWHIEIHSLKLQITNEMRNICLLPASLYGFIFLKSHLPRYNCYVHCPLSRIFLAALLLV